ncbi:hypothetical protein [Roseomonas marmotae]|uniref:Uncharacterized protein n=1 Tax=Roseomonas marmotae TaxID=2768161 RepID=A0ABS3KAG2_9PROT|nr:hypothetical protein [Roseomonas marmotae]MBO1074422.1 hypothetical protein [Roseomonas marmotae]QTI78159.1 hypothetical protein IAI58_10590 [Roseomonas marmotae]
MRLRIFGLAAWLLATAAQAAPLRDPGTGLTVNPPPGYVATAKPPDQRHAATISIKRSGDSDEGCEVGFLPAAGNARFSQEQINTLVGTPAWRDAIVARLAPVYEVTDTALVEVNGIRGMVLLGDFKPRRDLPPRARQMRNFFAVLETPRGHTNIVCVAEKDSFRQRQPEFEGVVRGTTAP